MIRWPLREGASVAKQGALGRPRLVGWLSLSVIASVTAVEGAAETHLLLPVSMVK